MTAINKRRVWLGALAGGVVWNAWSFVVNGAILAPRYQAAQAAGQFLAQPRYGSFLPVWVLTIFALSYIATLLYASARATCGPGPKTALGIGVMVGFVSGFPHNFAILCWSTMSRAFPFWWTLEMGLGAIAATLIGAWLYRDEASPAGS